MQNFPFRLTARLSQDEYNKNCETKDDCILLEIISEMRSLDGDSVMVMTDDLNVEIKAERLGLQVICPEEKHMKPLKQDDKIKLEKLQRENENLKSERPLLSLQFAGDVGSFYSLNLTKKRHTSSAYVR